MQVYEMTLEDAPLVAEMMATQIPEWWDTDSALKQITASDKICWYIGENIKTPKGFICIKVLEEYSCVEMEICAFDGEYSASAKTVPLFEKMEEFAIGKGLRMIRTVVTSTGMSCHGKEVNNYIYELSNLESTNGEYLYMLSCGYKLAGFLPNCYGKNEHGIMIIKSLCM